MPLRETTFISRNVEGWRRLERELARPQPDPDVLHELYEGVSADLSYARTHYPNRSVRAYLNTAATRLTLSLYRNRRAGVGVARFFAVTVPAEIYRQRVPLLIALAIFLLGFAVGWGSGLVDPAFAERILGAEYVEMTETNIAEADPMRVYKEGSRLGGALGIAGNNLWVSMLCFVTGLFAGVGTLFVLLRNAIMVGTFQQFFFARGVGWESVLGIWTHGTIEISCIVVAAGAGFVLARGLLFPGTLSRGRAFQLAGLSGLRIMAGIAPLIVLAGVIEGFLTRLTDIPTPLRVLFLLLNAAFVLYYFVLRPRAVGRHESRDHADHGSLPPERPVDWSEPMYRPAGTIFFETVTQWLRAGGAVWGGVAALAAGTALLAVLLHPDGPDGLVYGVVHAHAFAALGSYPAPTAALAIAVLAGGLALATARVQRHLPGGRPAAFLPYAAAASGVWSLLLVCATYSLWISLAFLPLAALVLRALAVAPAPERWQLGAGLRQDFGGFLGLTLMIAVAAVLLQLGFAQAWDQFAYPFLAQHLTDASGLANAVLTLWPTLFLAPMVGLFGAYAFGVQYHALLERLTARDLRRRLGAAFKLATS